MLRVGLTGGLGSGKSTAARLFAAHGAHILSSDEIGRKLMQPGEFVYQAIVNKFGSSVLLPRTSESLTDLGHLDRAALARIAFAEQRTDELNAIVHPAVIEHLKQITTELAARNPHAVVVVESALIFETKFGGSEGWRHRFNKLILVTAPEDVKVSRFVSRSSEGRQLTGAERILLEQEAHRRIAQQIPDEQKSSLCDYVLANDGLFTHLEWQVDRLWPLLTDAEALLNQKKTR